jgi:hypothetical protein
MHTFCQKVTGYRTRTNPWISTDLLTKRLERECLEGGGGGTCTRSDTYFDVILCHAIVWPRVRSTPHRRYFQAIHRKPRFAPEYPRKIADMGQFFSKANPALVAI